MTRCKNCKYAKENWRMKECNLTTFECRYNPPDHDGFPRVHADWWCSKGEENE